MHNSNFISSKYIEILIKSLRFFCIEMKLFYQAISIITTIDRDLPNVEKPTMHTTFFCMLYAFFLFIDMRICLTNEILQRRGKREEGNFLIVYIIRKVYILHKRHFIRKYTKFYQNL